MCVLQGVILSLSGRPNVVTAHGDEVSSQKDFCRGRHRKACPQPLHGYEEYMVVELVFVVASSCVLHRAGGNPSRCQNNRVSKPSLSVWHTTMGTFPPKRHPQNWNMELKHGMISTQKTP